MIGKPLAIVAIIVIGLVARWLLHRVVDRIVRGPRKACCPTGSTG